MARPREFDTTTAIAHISEQFWAAGYEATGITDLENATGLARARLYAAFGPKRRMLHEALDYYLEHRVDLTFRGVNEGGLAGVVRFFHTFAQIVHERPERSALGCLMVNSMIELGRADPEVAARGDRYRSRVRGAFRQALQKAARDGHIAGDVEPRADLAFLMLMGLFVAVKGGAPMADLQHLCDIAIHTVESWQVSPTRTAGKNGRATPLPGHG